MKAENNKQPVILMVDDNTINLQLLHETLDGQGYRLLAARSGEEALRIARKAQPDLILLDIMMPGIDGYDTCARLKSDEATHNSVVIFLTALQSTEEKVRGLSMGAMTLAGRSELEPAVRTADEVKEPLNRRVEITLSN